MSQPAVDAHVLRGKRPLLEVPLLRLRVLLLRRLVFLFTSKLVKVINVLEQHCA